MKLLPKNDLEKMLRREEVEKMPSQGPGAFSSGPKPEGEGVLHAQKEPCSSQKVSQFSQRGGRGGGRGAAAGGSGAAGGDPSAVGSM